MSLLLLSLAHADSLRAIDGAPVVLEAGVVLVAWELDDPQSVAVLREAASVGRPVIAVNEDPPGGRARLRGWLRAQGLDLTIVADPDHALADRFGLTVGAAGVIDAQGRLTSLETSGVRLAER